MENFRYLGSDDFTGRVFYSALEGEFVKAFGYTNGQFNGNLLVMKRSELAKHAEKGGMENYSSISLREGVITHAATYSYNEDNSSGEHWGDGIGEDGSWSGSDSKDGGIGGTTPPNSEHTILANIDLTNE